MISYRDTNNQLHFLDSEEFESFLPIGCVKLSDAEAAALAEKNQAAHDQVCFERMTYQQKRAPEYPPLVERIDGMVKQSSSDPAVRAEGIAQVEAYDQTCLAVKARIPKI